MRTSTGLIFTLCLLVFPVLSGAIDRTTYLNAGDELGAEINRDRLAFYFDNVIYVSGIGYNLLRVSPDDTSGRTFARLSVLYVDVNGLVKESYPASGGVGVIAIGKIAPFAGNDLDIKRGDRILKVDGKEVGSEDDIHVILSEVTGRPSITVELGRDDRIFTVEIPLVYLERNISFYIDTRSSSVNAYTNSKDYLAVTTQMLKFMDSEETLAFIIAHELGHIAKNHWITGSINREAGITAGLTLGSWVAKQVPDVPAIGTAAAIVAYHVVSAPVGQAMEREADEEALRYMRNGGYRPEGAIRSLRRLAVEIPDGQEGSIISTHPATPERIGYLRQAIGEKDQYSTGSDLAFDISEFLLDRSLYVTSISYKLLKNMRTEKPGREKTVFPFLWQKIDERLMRAYGFDKPKGVMSIGPLPVLSEVGLDIKRGDLIEQVQGVPVKTHYDMTRQIRQVSNLKWAVVGLKRKDKTWDLQVPVINLPYDIPVYVKGNMMDLYSGSSARGEIIISTPLLRFARGEDDLAFLIAHETAHLILKHSGFTFEHDVDEARDLGYKLGSALGGFAADLTINQTLDTVQAKANLRKIPFSQKQELEADKLAIQYMRDAGYDPAAAYILLRRLATEIWYASPESLTAVHPITYERLARLKAIEGTAAEPVPFKEPTAQTPPSSEDMLGPIPNSGAVADDPSVISIGLAESVPFFRAANSKMRPCYRFSRDVKMIYWYTLYDSVKSFGHVFDPPSFTIEWYAPDGSLAQKNEFKLSAAYPDSVKSALDLSKVVSPLRSGRWRVKVYQKTKLFDDRYFLIE